MNRKELLERTADELRCNGDNRFDFALLTLIETFADLADDEDIRSYTRGNIGIIIARDYVELIDATTKNIILSLEVN